MKNLFLLIAVLGFAGCDSNVKVINKEPVKEVSGGDGLTPSQRFLSAVVIASEKTWGDGSVHVYHYPGTKIAENLVLTSILAKPKTATPMKVFYKTNEGVEKEVTASYFKKESRYWLMVIETSEKLDIPTASYKLELPKLGTKVFIVSGGKKYQYIVSGTEMRYNGYRFRIWPKEAPKTLANLNDCTPIFDEEGFIVGFTTNETYRSHTAIDGYEDSETVVYPAFFVQKFYTEALNPRTP